MVGMSAPFCLVQLSDSHVSADPDTEYRGHQPLARLKRLDETIRRLAPDAIVLTGDVSEDGSAESYQQVAEWVGGWCDDIAWLPGNHDQRAVMEVVFDRPGFNAGPLIERGGWQLVLLDSAWRDRPEGELDDERLKPLERLTPGMPALVFVHHQPIAIGSPWIDVYPLVANHRLWERLDSRTVHAIAFGHVHQVFEGEHQGIACLSAPSTVANSHASTKTFSDDGSGPGTRVFRMWPDGRWASEVVYA